MPVLEETTEPGQTETAQEEEIQAETLPEEKIEIF